MAIPATPLALQKRARAILRPFMPKELEYRLGITKEPKGRESFGQRFTRGALRTAMPRQLEYSFGLRPRKFPGRTPWEEKVRSFIPFTKERKKAKRKADLEFHRIVKDRAKEILGKNIASKKEWARAEAQALKEMKEEALRSGMLMGKATKTKEGFYKRPTQIDILGQFIHKK
jgi:hypothetical protein